LDLDGLPSSCGTEIQIATRNNIENNACTKEGKNGLCIVIQ